MLKVNLQQLYIMFVAGGNNIFKPKFNKMRKISLFLIPIVLLMSCKKATTDTSYFYKYKIGSSQYQGDETSGAVAVSVQNSSIFMALASQSDNVLLEIASSPFTPFNGVGNYPIGSNGYMLTLTMPGGDYLVTNGTLVISEYNPPSSIRGTINATLESISNPGSTIQISEGSFFLPATQ